tara:strand:- start:7 stop:912 length:906 start_codon:yes stop_codon:yes gene_type:complete
MFGFGVQTPTLPVQPNLPQPIKPEEGVKNIIGQNLNQGGGGGIPMVGSDGRIADFNEAITVRQNRLNDPGKIAQFAYDIGVPKQASYNEMLSRGMLGAKDTRATSGLPLGIGGILAKALPDNYYDKMTLGDQIVTQSYMGYTDPETGMSNKDPFGINVRSAFGNYVEKAQEILDILAEKKARNDGYLSNYDLAREKLYSDVVNKKKNVTADLALIQKAKDQERAAADLAAQKALATANRGFLNSQEAARMTSQQQGERAAGMGGGSRQAKSGSQKAGGSGRKDGGWGWKDGGRVYLYNRLK